MNFVIKRHSNHYYCNCRQIINGIYFIQIGSIIICGLLGQWRVYYTHTTTQLYYFPHTYMERVFARVSFKNYSLKHFDAEKLVRIFSLFDPKRIVSQTIT